MISIAIGDIRHNPDHAWLTLQGGTLLPGLKGAIYEPAASHEALVEERITLSLRGTHAEMNEVLMRLNDKLALSQRSLHEQVGCPIYLRVKAEPAGGYYYARILQAHLEPHANSLSYFSTGSLRFDIVFTRPNSFTSDEILLPLSNSSQSRVTNGLALVNHDDSAHDNAFLVDMEDVSTMLPAPVRLELMNTHASGQLKDLFIGSLQYNTFGWLAQLVYEGETGSGGSTISSAAASNSAYQRHSWSASGWSTLTTWTLAADDLAAFQGRTVLPMLRLANAHAYSDLRLKLSVSSGSMRLFEGGEVPSLSGMGYVSFPPLRLPCGELLGLSYPSPQLLQLQVYKPGSTSYTLDIDDLLLIPQDSFSQHLGLVPLAQGDLLMDDAFEGLSYSLYGGYELGTHIALNSGHTLQPSHSACFMVFQGDGSSLAPIDRSIAVRAWYRQCRRIL